MPPVRYVAALGLAHHWHCTAAAAAQRALLPCLASSIMAGSPRFADCSEPTCYAQSVHVSGDCLSILTRVLVASPTERLSMEAIKTHPWFLAGLPPGALDMNEFLLRGMEPFNLSMVCPSKHTDSLSSSPECLLYRLRKLLVPVGPLHSRESWCGRPQAPADWA